MKRLSVIIPGYNNPDAYWERCLNSVVAACGPDDEIICVDDGSAHRPSCVEINLRTQPEIKWMYLEKNMGQSAARNCALEIASGEWVTFVDSDDAVYPDVYTKCFSGIKANPLADVVVFGVRGIWLRESMTRFDCPDDAWLGVLDVEKIRHLYDARLFEYPVNKLYRRSFLDSHNIRFELGVCPGEDSVFNLSCANAGAKWCAVAYVGYKYYRMDGTSLSRYLPRRVESLKRKAECWQAFVDKYGDEEGVLTDLCVFNESAMVKVAWDNIWRKGTPFGLHDRWRWLKVNSQYFTASPVAAFLRKYILSVIRRYFYFSWVYKLHIKRYYSDFISFKSEDGF